MRKRKQWAAESQVKRDFILIKTLLFRLFSTRNSLIPLTLTHSLTHLLFICVYVRVFVCNNKCPATISSTRTK